MTVTVGIAVKERVYGKSGVVAAGTVMVGSALPLTRTVTPAGDTTFTLNESHEVATVRFKKSADDSWKGGWATTKG